MKLKKLELVGFKSFASKVSLSFDQGITAIVGPNGSGKSNISDAVRWVLGEQSAKSLRGSKMEDIIFGGSTGKRALGMAEVQLTLDNADGFLAVDFNEVTIARRVYRSGESDFLINKQPCRLKDIHDMLTDTGLGREGYAIIGQGQIDTVLSVRSYDRRILLEETAGIIKYRNRKESALHKIDQTNQDLNRIQDILRELRRQQTPLGKEADKARRYQKLAAELRELELDHFALILSSLEQRRERLEKEHTEKSEHFKALQQDCESQEDQVKQGEEQLRKLSQEIEETQDQLHSISEKLNAVVHSKDLTKQRLDNLGEREAEQKARQQQAQKELERLSLSQQELAGQHSELLAKFKEADRALASEQSKLASDRENYEIAGNQVDSLKNEFFDFMRSLSDTRNHIQTKKDLKKSKEQQILGFSEDLELLTTSYDQVKGEIKDLQRDLGNIDQAFQEISTQGQARRQEEKNLLERLASLNQQIAGQARTCHQLESKLATLNELEKDYEGYNYAVRSLMQQQLDNCQLLGTVGDLLRVPANLGVALETALGATVQNVITPSQADAKIAINWLKQKRAGRVTFLPLDIMQSRSFPESYSKYWQHPDVLGPALDLVNYDSKYHPAISSLIGRVVITKHLDAALALQRELPSFSRIVTLQGELITPSGAITGGSNNSKIAGLLTRKNEITKLACDLQQAKADLQALEEHKAAFETKLTEANQVVEDLRHQASENRQAAQDLSKRISVLESEETHLADQLSKNRQQQQTIKSEIDQIEQAITETTSKLDQLAQEEQAKRQEITHLEEEYRILKTVIEQNNDHLTEKKVKLTQLKGELANLRNKQQDLQERQENLLKQEADSGQELENHQQQRDELEKDLIGYAKQADQYSERKEEANVKLSELKARHHQLQEGNDQANEQLTHLRKAANHAQKALHNVDLDHNKLELETQKTVEDIAQREAIPEQVLQRPVKLSREKLKQEINSLRQAVRELGVINPGAIEEYAALTERVDFLTDQVNDLEKAKEALLKVIAEMDATSEKRFWNTFQKVKTEFQNLFSQLFQGGKADLILTDPEDLLGTGIEIVAQPPGKKLQNMLLLSGGERALTAIALLFAIRKIKPTPFCILDEIDAALDDANLARFATMMKEFAKNTQFLVITHRQGTMEEANCLYGVTMGESAVSQLVSVKLA